VINAVDSVTAGRFAAADRTTRIGVASSPRRINPSALVNQAHHSP
jgi:hypothetical protein